MISKPGAGRELWKRRELRGQREQRERADSLGASGHLSEPPPTSRSLRPPLGASAHHPVLAPSAGISTRSYDGSVYLHGTGREEAASRVVRAMALNITRQGACMCKTHRVPRMWKDLEPFLQTGDYAHPEVFWAFVAAHPGSRDVYKVLEIVFEAAKLIQRHGDWLMQPLCRVLRLQALRALHEHVRQRVQQPKNPSASLQLEGGFELAELMTVFTSVLTLTNMFFRFIRENKKIAAIFGYVNMFIGGISAYHKTMAFASKRGYITDMTLQAYSIPELPWKHIQIMEVGMGLVLGGAVVRGMYREYTKDIVKHHPAESGLTESMMTPSLSPSDLAIVKRFLKTVSDHFEQKDLHAILQSLDADLHSVPLTTREHLPAAPTTAQGNVQDDNVQDEERELAKSAEFRESRSRDSPSPQLPPAGDDDDFPASLPPNVDGEGPSMIYQTSSSPFRDVNANVSHCLTHAAAS
jgi:hypothetical protein